MNQDPKYDIHFDAVESDPKSSKQGVNKYYKYRGDTIRIDWDGPKPIKYRFHHPGPEAVMILPIPGLFEEDVEKTGIHILKGEPLDLTLRDKEDIIAEHGGTLVLDGLTKYNLSIFDKETRTYAEGNSPPPIRLGP